MNISDNFTRNEHKHALILPYTLHMCMLHTCMYAHTHTHTHIHTHTQRLSDTHTHAQCMHRLTHTECINRNCLQLQPERSKLKWRSNSCACWQVFHVHRHVCTCAHTHTYTHTHIHTHTHTHTDSQTHTTQAVVTYLMGLFASLPCAVGLLDEGVATLEAPKTVPPVRPPHTLFTHSSFTVNARLKLKY